MADQIVKLFGLPKPEQKKASWHDMEKRIAEYGGKVVSSNKKFAEIIALELTGGKCPICQKGWIKVGAENKFAIGEYYKPTCLCLPHCPACGRLYYWEYFHDKLTEKSYCNCRLRIDKDKHISGVPIQMHEEYKKRFAEEKIEEEKKPENDLWYNKEKDQMAENEKEATMWTREPLTEEEAN